MSFAATPDVTQEPAISGPQEESGGAPMEGADLIKEFSAWVRKVDLSVTELETKVALLLDNVNSAKATRDCMDALNTSQDCMKQAKAVNRK